MDLDLVREKLHSGVIRLVLDPGPIHDRVRSAFMEFHILSAGDFPPDLVSQFKGIMASLTDVEPVAGGGLAMAALVKMTEGDCSNLAKRIFTLYQRVSQKVGHVF